MPGPVGNFRPLLTAESDRIFDSDCFKREEKFDSMPYLDLHQHLKNLEEHGLLRRITRLINKDTELHPLVRWQYRGLSEEDRRAWLFENVTDAKGQTLDYARGRRRLGGEA